MCQKEVSCCTYTFSLINVRIVFLLIAFLHLVIAALATLTIDTRVDADPSIQAYYYLKWKLITCWFNLLTLIYLPVRLYCDWRTTLGDRNSLLRKLYHYSDVVMTSILFPVTLFSDIMFWYLFSTNPDLLAPPRLWSYLPVWAQHSLHTVSAVVVLLDLVLTPRQRPKALMPRFGLLVAFSCIYILVIYISRVQGEQVYVCVTQMNSGEFVTVSLISFAIVYILFIFQWLAIAHLWGKNPNKEKI